MRRDLFFTIYQLRHAKRQLEKVQTTNKQIATRKMQGTLNTDRNNVRSENNKLLLDGDLLTIEDDSGNTRVEIGNVGGEFVFNLYAPNGTQVIHFDESGNGIFSGTIRGGKIESDTQITVTTDAIIGKYLRVGFVKTTVKPDGTAVYEYQPNCGIIMGDSKIVSDDEEYQLNISSFNGVGKINFEANSVTQNGSELATRTELNNLKYDIRQIQLKISELENK